MNAALYIRVSTQEQAREGYSLTAQKNTLKDFCRLKGYSVSYENIYTDEGVSAKSISKREGLQKLINNTKNFDVVVIWKISRIARSMRDLLYIEETLRSDSVSLVSITEYFDTSTPSGRLMLQILGAFAEFEREVMIENITFALKEKVSQGEKNFAEILGYDVRNGKVLINESEQKLVQLIFSTYRDAKNLSKTAEIINNLGHKGLRGKPFAANSISVIINNTNYIGILEYKDKEFYIAKDFKGCLDLEIFLECQRIKLESGRVNSKGYKSFKERYERLRYFISENQKNSEL